MSASPHSASVASTGSFFGAGTDTHARTARSASAGIGVSDAQGVLVYVNEAHAELFGYASVGELIGMNWRSLLPETEVRAVEDNVMPVIRQGRSWSGEIVGRRKDGSTLKLRCEMEQASNGYIYCRCLSEISVRQLESRLGATERLLRSVLERMPVPVFIKDTNRRIVFINEHGLQLFGLTASQALDVPDEELPLDQKLKAQVAAMDRQVAETGAPVRCDITLQTPVGQRTFDVLKVRIEPDLDTLGAKIASLWLDVTADRELRARTEDLLREQQQYLLMQREFVSMVSHEFRTPLATMQGVLFMMQNATGDDPEKRQRWIGMLRQSVGTLRELADQVLELNRMGGDLPPVQITPLALTPFVHRYVATQADLHGANRVVAEIDPLAPSVVRANSSLLRTVLDHFCANALKYSDPESIVRLRVGPVAGGVRLSVIDQGNGIALSDQARIWEPFYRSPSSRHISGTGLGLPIAHRAAELIGATVGFESTPGTGSVFWIQFPVTPS